MSGLTNCHIQLLILNTAGQQPTIPNPITLTPDDPGWIHATDILRGELAYNSTDGILYTRKINDIIIQLATTLNERTGTQSLTTGINTITFSTPFAGINYFVLTYIIRNTGQVVIGTILNKTVNGFQIDMTVLTGTIWYLAKYL